ncbi:efflux RND transporter periplasmic adaptor subunit [Sutcliffiella horikoshii]|uniref:efflux RND transporter periplasmic adaptor subunit n=1 Tax=Sutcliffiella horikoshii TaxID=79883 RepID=UPI00203C83D2|nr:efflux RND transporter periplasmic adaptor subunit [Sutcliffiella horikoshii]MCM3616854.1 efflux RND transporter periplasmic adaptor subunit [Sutcliffiella horikoshii]
MLKKYWLLPAMFVLLFSTACSQKEITSQNTESNKIPVTMAEVTEKNISNTIELVGLAVPETQVPLLTTSPLTVETVHVKIGDIVKKGDLIVTLDSEAATEQVNQAQSAVTELENALSKMKEMQQAAENQASLSDIPKLQEELNQSLEKSQALLDGVDTGAVTSLDLVQSTVDVMVKQAQLANAASQVQQMPTFNTMEMEAQLNQARQGLKQAQQMAEATSITSPIDGIISELNVVADGIASPNVPIGTVIQLDNIAATFQVNSYQVSKLKDGLDATVSFEGLPDSYESKIETVSPTVNQQTNMFSVTIPVSNTELEIKGGMRATAFVAVDNLEAQTVVPMDAILYEEANPYVYIIEEGKAVRQDVTTGFRDNEFMQIIEGLKKGQTVAVNGKERLKDGAEILEQKSE